MTEPRDMYVEEGGDGSDPSLPEDSQIEPKKRPESDEALKEAEDPTE